MIRKRSHNKLLKIFRKIRFKNISITHKLLLCFNFIFISIILLSYFNFINYRNDKEKSVFHIINQSNIQTTNKIDDFFTDLNNISKFPLVTHLEDKNFINELELFSINNTRSISFKSMSNKMFENIFNYKKQINSVFLFNLQGRSEYEMHGSAIYKDFNPENEHWFKESIEKYGKPVVVGTFLLPNTTSVQDKPLYVFSMARGIVSLRSSKVVGVILINLKVDFLANLCNKMIAFPKQRIIIVDSQNNVVYDTVTKNITKKLETEFTNIIGNSSTNKTNLKVDGVDNLISYTTSNVSGWKMINVIPVNDLNKEINQIGKRTITITFILIFITSLFISLISRQIVIPIKKLVLLMKLVKKGDFNVKIKIKSRDEIGQLAATFNSMTKRVNKLVKESYTEKLKQKELELQMLQNQINPHFLYNTLESIHMMAEINHDNQSSKMARALGKILRYGISRNIVKVTVREEIDHLQDYIMLQEIRFEDIFCIYVNIDENMSNLKIIKLILQPILENSIYHGLDDREDGGIINVVGYLENDNIVFEVTDNGKGMNIDMVNRLNDYINDLNNCFNSIGLKNVNKRIKLHYGNEYGLEIYSEEDVGTKVRVIIPKF